MFKFGAKVIVSLAVVNESIKYGIWDDSATTSALYNEIQSQTKPYIKPYIDEIPAPTLPKAGDVVSTGKVMWNKGVMHSFEFLTRVPDLAYDYSVRGAKFTYDKINELIEAANSEPAKES